MEITTKKEIKVRIKIKIKIIKAKVINEKKKNLTIET
jgi:hypothetical protein